MMGVDVVEATMGLQGTMEMQADMVAEITTRAMIGIVAATMARMNRRPHVVAQFFCLVSNSHV